ncbi:hypothetical protein KM043_001103 [Ampulex compressa]|nr:hypothetical protein KM043_001103 [Ampulex compressa]
MDHGDCALAPDEPSRRRKGSVTPGLLLPEATQLRVGKIPNSSSPKRDSSSNEPESQVSQAPMIQNPKYLKFQETLEFQATLRFSFKLKANLARSLTSPERSCGCVRV